ncbi:hypothetical protein AVEN_119255-1 [Araneus ventricosus]|uniref:Uncharacterized protein n=1 Tax=Araneus ventricosus TaxID=182803 RepID=A0A4Y2PWB3_ARAVE|nr:hypothetical protein AVEN_119255-1 [Araneus ventricosus]
MPRTTPELTPPSPNFRTTPAGGRLTPTYDLACSRPKYTTELQWNRVSNLEPSGPKAETLPEPRNKYSFIFETDLLSLNHGQMAETEHEPAPFYPNFHTTPVSRCSTQMDLTCMRSGNDRTCAESDVEPATLHRSRT